MENDMNKTSSLIKTIIKSINKTVLVSLDIDFKQMSDAYNITNGTNVDLIPQGQNNIDSIVKALSRIVYSLFTREPKKMFKKDVGGNTNPLNNFTSCPPYPTPCSPHKWYTH
jgi:hypothetical protein